MKFIAKPGGHCQGHLQIPGDKSISHRAVMLGAIAEGTTQIKNILLGQDNLATIDAFRAMGVPIEIKGNWVIVKGVGLSGLQQPKESLYLGNSGTSIRLLMGLLAKQPFSTTLSGDDSLNKRPMQRVITPLEKMGAKICSEKGKPPIQISPSASLKGIEYEMPMASAQVKSAILLAGLGAKGKTTVIEPGITRDHSERMLRAFGAEVISEEGRCTLQPTSNLQGIDIEVPGDISSAMFFIVAALIQKQTGDLLLENVGVNPTRIGGLKILQAMGARIELLNPRTYGEEPVADIRVSASNLKGIEIPEALIPLAIDEIPIISVAAACAEGVTHIRGAEELRVKESDRIQAMAVGLKAVGIEVEERPDGMSITGGPINGGTVHSFDDHRIAMSFVVASLASKGTIEVSDCDNVATSFPSFVDSACQVGISLTAVGEKNGF